VRRLTLFEHGRLRAVSDEVWPTEGTAWEQPVPLRWFERLQRFDDKRGEQRVFEWGYHRAKATQFVGVIQLGGVSLEILPKVESEAEEADEVRSNLLWFLSCAGEVPCRERDLAALKTRKAPLLDALTAIFATRLWDELLRGVSRAYVPREENLRRLKGRLVIPLQVTRNAAHRERFVCRFDEFSEDTPLNQVLRCVSEILLRGTRVSAARDVLSRCVEVLDGVTVIAADRARVVASRIVLDRAAARFAPLLSFARMVLASRSAEVIAGETSTFSLLFDMNQVFEGLVTYLVSRVVQQEFPEWEVHPQGHGEQRHLFAGDGSLRHLLPLMPDVLLKGPDGRYGVIDAKWKRIGLKDRGKGPRREDLYQLHGYGTRYAAPSLVLHPKSAEHDATAGTWFALDAQERRQLPVTFATLDLARDFGKQDERAKLEQDLRALLSGLLQNASKQRQSTAVQREGQIHA
jgi:5-methylcytosine-specific restriction enzyme subunit McrC